jgi:hypothetical protein
MLQQMQQIEVLQKQKMLLLLPLLLSENLVQQPLDLLKLQTLQLHPETCQVGPPP